MVKFKFKHSVLLGNKFIHNLLVLFVIHLYFQSTILFSIVDGVAVRASIQLPENDDVDLYSDDYIDYESKLNVSYSTLPSTFAHSYFFYIFPPNFPCDSDFSCSQYGNLPLNCSAEGQCECEPPLCWTYTIDESWFTVHFLYSCGECGGLGSICETLQDCNPPGYCAKDGFCHCLEGEHKEDICFVKKNNAAFQILEGSLFLIIIIAGAAVIYNTFKSYHRNRTLIWCRCRHRRSRRRRQPRSRAHVTTDKSPAYTSQQRIMQDFHLSDESTSNDELTDDESTNNIDIESSQLATVNTDLPPSYENSQTQNISISEYDKNKTQENAENPHPTTSDTSGMTEYFNSHTTNL